MDHTKLQRLWILSGLVLTGLNVTGCGGGGTDADPNAST
ncbi:MAG: hypothetical protein RJA44_1235, partial [Pseudomonadota bacterium]